MIMLVVVFSMLVESIGLRAEAQPCISLMTIVVPGGTYRPLHRNLQRVEVQRCSPGVGDGLRLVAWADQGSSPGLSVDTAGGDVQQLFVGRNTFLLELSGGGRNHVYAITYSAGKPTVALKRATTGRASIRSDGSTVELQVPNQWTKQVERYSYVLEQR
jgi:hypothetical protein